MSLKRKANLIPQGLQEDYTVIFLLDHPQPERVILLKRAPDKTFAPNEWTGIGGKIDAGETALSGAERELLEETGLAKIALSEFARCLVHRRRRLFYFAGFYPHQKLPSSPDGHLAWIKPTAFETLPIIPNTHLMLIEWRRRQFRLDQPWTTKLLRARFEDYRSPLISLEIQEGLA